MAKNQINVQEEAARVSTDMRELYDEFRAGGVKRDDADTAANIAGKNLKSLAIIIADKLRETDQLTFAAKAKAIVDETTIKAVK